MSAAFVSSNLLHAMLTTKHAAVAAAAAAGWQQPGVCGGYKD
jgi:hypothetical protein